MGIRGRNVQVNGVRVNDTLLPPGTAYTFQGATSDTEYVITATNVDDAGNESAPSPVLIAKTLQYTAPGPNLPMSSADAMAIDAIVAEEMVSSKSAGVAIATTGPRGRLTKAYGSTATTGGRPLTIDDHFRLASATKSYTETAVLMAIDRGELSLDDTLSQFVPNVPSGNLITVRQMLMMRSGIFDYQSSLGFILSFTLFPTMAYTDEALLLYIQGNPSQFTPGTKYQYTNGNYVLLGLVLKAVTGRRIKNIIAEDILAPLSLAETKWPDDSVLPPPAGGTTNWNPGYFGAAGALTSTVGDMLKWAAELRDSTLISPELAQLRETYFVGYPSGGLPPPLPPTFGYGLGMLSTGTWLGHDGSLPGFSTYIGFDTVSGALFAGAENQQTVAPVPLAIYSRIFSRIADYLYPGSMDTVDYNAVNVRPAPARLTITGGVPPPSAWLIAPAAAVLRIVGGTPAIAIAPAAAALTLTGETPTIELAPATSVTYGSTGAGAPTGAPFSITVADGDTVVLYLVTDHAANPTATCGGVPMMLHSQLRMNASSGTGVMCLFVLGGMFAGAKTISFTGGNWTAAQAVAYANVNGLGVPRIATGTGAPSQAVTVGSATTMVSQAFGVGQSAGFSSPTGGTNRSLSNYFASLVVNDAAANVTFAVTRSGTPTWVGIAVRMLVAAPAMPYYVGLTYTPGAAGSGATTFTGPVVAAGDYVVVNVEVSSTSSTVSAVTYDGVAMTQLGSTLTYTGSGAGRLLRFGIVAPAAGARTVSFSRTGGNWASADAVAIRNVTTVVATATATGSGSPSHAVTLSANELVLQTFGTAGSLGQIRGGSNLNDTEGGPNFTAVGTSIADATTTFTSSATGIAWGSIATRFS